MPASFAAASSAAMSAPGSLASRRLKMALNPIFAISGTDSALVAPAQATVVSRRAKLRTPSTSGLLTCCIPSRLATATGIRNTKCVMRCSPPTAGLLRRAPREPRRGASPHLSASRACVIRSGRRGTGLEIDRQFLQKHLQITPHHQMWNDMDPFARTLAGEQELVERFERHSPLREWALIDGCRDSSGTDAHHQLRKEVSGDDREAGKPALVLSRVQYGQRVDGADVDSPEIRMLAQHRHCTTIGLPLVVVCFDNRAELQRSGDPEAGLEAAKFFRVLLHREPACEECNLSSPWAEAGEELARNCANCERIGRH